MKFIHMSDLHLGKRVNEFSMIDDQRYILNEILNIINEQKPDAVIIAGDIYDKSVPGADAVMLLDDFLTRLAAMNLHVFMISGNHDSSERISFGARLMEKSRIHVSEVYRGSVSPVKLEDNIGTVNVYMLPFVKPAVVRHVFPDEQIESYTDAVACAVRHMDINTEERNILVTHQTVTGSARCDSEETVIGGTDNVEPDVFDVFDYVALGHIHGAQKIGRETMRYSGTPLKYSFSEEQHIKSLAAVDVNEKGNICIDTIPLNPLRDMITVKGLYRDIIERAETGSISRDSYVRIILTDEQEEPDAVNKLRYYFPNIMKLEYDNTRTGAYASVDNTAEENNLSPYDYFAGLYELQNNQPLSKEQGSYVKNVFDNIMTEERV